MNDINEKIEVAKITSRRAVLVAIITAIAGLAAGYFGKQASVPSEATQARSDLASLKQRVRDILGPKEDKIRQMSQSLERMKNDPGVSQDHRERLAEIVQELDKIDNKVLTIVGE